MTIRFACIEDVDRLVGHWREFHASSRFSHLAFDEVKFAAHMRRVIEERSGSFCFLVADADADLAIGALVGQIDSYYFSADPIARSLLYWTHPDHRGGSVPVRLLLAFKQWADNRGAREILVRLDADEQSGDHDATLKAIGFIPLGGNYVLDADAGGERR